MQSWSACILECRSADADLYCQMLFGTLAGSYRKRYYILLVALAKSLSNSSVILLINTGKKDFYFLFVFSILASFQYHLPENSLHSSLHTLLGLGLGSFKLFCKVQLQVN